MHCYLVIAASYIYFCNLIFDFNLDQQITEPTHKGGNLLDVILTVIPNVQKTYQSGQLYHMGSPLTII